MNFSAINAGSINGESLREVFPFGEFDFVFDAGAEEVMATLLDGQIELDLAFTGQPYKTIHPDGSADIDLDATAISHMERRPNGMVTIDFGFAGSIGYGKPMSGMFEFDFDHRAVPKLAIRTKGQADMLMSLSGVTAIEVYDPNAPPVVAVSASYFASTIERTMQVQFEDRAMLVAPDRIQ